LATTTSTRAWRIGQVEASRRNIFIYNIRLNKYIQAGLEFENVYRCIYILQEGDVNCLDFYWAGFKGDMFRSLFGKGPYVRERASLGSDALAFRTNYFPNVLFFFHGKLPEIISMTSFDVSKLARTSAS